MSRRSLKVSDLHPDLRSIYRILPPFPVHCYAFQKIAAYTFSHYRTPALIDDIDRQVFTVNDSGQTVRVFSPKPSSEPTPALLWIHGGGMVTGAAIQDDRPCMLIASALKIPVISVDYRLAPLYPYPAALDDCAAAWQWTIEQSNMLGIDPSRVGIGGQSAGGGLAASLANRIQTNGGIPPKAQLLMCPMLDDHTADNHNLDQLNHFAWTNKNNRYAWSVYLNGVDSTDLSDAVPARKLDLHGLPTTWIGVGTLDLFYEEAKKFAERLKTAGVNTSFVEVPQAPHAFERLAWKTPLATSYLQQAAAWLESALRN